MAGEVFAGINRSVVIRPLIHTHYKQKNRVFSEKLGFGITL